MIYIKQELWSFVLLIFVKFGVPQNGGRGILRKAFCNIILLTE